MGGAGGGKVRAEGSMPCYERQIWGKLLHLAIGSSQTLPVLGHLCTLFLAPWDPDPSLLWVEGQNLLRRAQVEVSQVGAPFPAPFPPSSPEQ